MDNSNDLPYRFLASTWLDHKSEADESISYEHEGIPFHPCINSFNWIRWGKYVFDIREVKKIYNTSQDRELYTRIETEDFFLKIQSMLKLIGNEPFKNVLLRLSMSDDLN